MALVWTGFLIFTRQSKHSALGTFISTLSSTDRSQATSLNPFRKFVVKRKIKTPQPHSFQNGKSWKDSWKCYCNFFCAKDTSKKLMYIMINLSLKEKWCRNYWCCQLILNSTPCVSSRLKSLDLIDLVWLDWSKS